MMLGDSNRNVESGYTLVELMVVVAMIVTLVTVGTEFLAQQPAQLSSAVQQFALKIDETRGLALINAGRLDASNGTEAAAGGGATLWVQPDPIDANYTLSRVYWFRPISLNGNGGGVSADTSSVPLRTRVRISANVPKDGQSTSFAIFVSPSGHLSVVTDGLWKLGDGPLAQEPECDQINPTTLIFTNGGNTKTGYLVCNGAALTLR